MSFKRLYVLAFASISLFSLTSCDFTSFNAKKDIQQGDVYFNNERASFLGNKYEIYVDMYSYVDIEQIHIHLLMDVLENNGIGPKKTKSYYTYVTNIIEDSFITLTFHIPCYDFEYHTGGLSYKYSGSLA